MTSSISTSSSSSSSSTVAVPVTLESILSSGSLSLKKVYFKKATIPDVHNQLLKTKYIPVNTSQDSQVKVGGTDTTSTKQQQLEDPLQTNYELFPEENILKLLQWQDVKKVGAGLYNLGNTCFLNSALQCLSYTPPLANYVLQKGHTKACRTVGFCLFCALEKQIAQCLNSNGVIAPKGIVGNLKSIAKHFKLGRQEDSHEFIRYLIDGIQKSCLEGLDKKLLGPRIAETTVVHKIFGGYLQSQVKCSACGYCSNTFDPFLDLCLEIHGNSVESSFAKFTKPEILDKENKYKCPSCRKAVQAQKQFTIKRPPNVLTLQLKRFTYTSFFGGKIDKAVEFKEKLDLTPFLSKDSSSQNGSALYSLYAVLVHSGSSTRSGHYFSFVKSSSGAWYCMDDSSIRQVSLSTVLKQKAYMLFYVCSNSKIATITLTKKRKSEETEESQPATKRHQAQHISVSQPEEMSKFWSENVGNTKEQNKPIKVVAPKSSAMRDPRQVLESLQSTQKVTSWDGKETRTIEQIHTKVLTDSDLWNQELDKGRAKKIKKKGPFGYQHGHNPFQKVAQRSKNRKH